ncbi:MAG: tyrosine-type recombinase/integrase, partial [Treponema sp.]|nr:tyrosine-type recombinase/integrase [Treponema sp.]
HAYATFMLAQGVDLKVVSSLLGHSSISTTANLYTQKGSLCCSRQLHLFL